MAANQVGEGINGEYIGRACGSKKLNKERLLMGC